MLNEKSGTEYEMFELLGKEFTFTVDVSTLPCGLNGALYFVDMDKTGDKGSGNEAGAPYGTGYCDAQCPNDIKFINGKGNVEGWDNKTGSGKNGSCCAEMDIWEGNKIASAFTAHPCTIDGQQKCSDPVTCGFDDHRYDGVCDKDGCDLNPFRAGVKDFYGEGSDFMIDTSKPFSVVTAFHTDSNGDLSEIRRKFVQEGRLIEHPASKVDTMSK
jgi:cellulose 1,4-beta-cellobiosidase